MPDNADAHVRGTEGFGTYLDTLALQGQWGGFLQVAALAATLDRPIFILHEMGQVYCFNQEGSELDLFFWYSNLQGHYEALEV